MMVDVRELYQEAILDHNKRPRNYYKPESADRKAEGYNPLCGDRITVYLRIVNDVVREVGFQGSGCAISIASASMMTESVKGKRVAEVEALFERFHALVTQEPRTAPAALELGKLAAFAGVREFPIRVKCATLPWHTMRAAIENKQETVVTEKDRAVGEGPMNHGPTPAHSVEEQVVAVLRTVYDPEIPVNIYDLGLIYHISAEVSGAVTIKMTLTTPACPVAGMLIRDIESKIRALPGVAGAKIELVWDPPWNQTMMSEAAKLQLGLA